MSQCEMSFQIKFCVYVLTRKNALAFGREKRQCMGLANFFVVTTRIP